MAEENTHPHDSSAPSGRLHPLVQEFIRDKLSKESFDDWLASLWEYREKEVLSGLYLNTHNNGGAGIDWLDGTLDPGDGVSLESMVDEFIKEHGGDADEPSERGYFVEISESFDRMANKLRKLIS